jgi:hypothetical protein
MAGKKAKVTAFEVSDRVRSHARISSFPRDRDAPLARPLRIYALDPSVSDRVGGVATVHVPYEKLAPGPVGSVIEVRCDDVPAPLESEPLNLDDPYVLLSDGLAPSPSDGRFHRQMVYAVCTLTYSAFRRALGRDLGWATENPQRLVVRPFGFRGRNAAYSRETGDLSFGYFNAGKKPAGFTVRNSLICTALSHDIIVHETTHALLDSLRSSFLVPTNVDVPAFHEGFADLVALFLHFTYAEVVEQAIRGWGGPDEGSSLLTDIAREFGYSRSAHGTASALRSGLDVEGLAAFDSDRQPSKRRGPKLYDAGLEPHVLGSVLVSAVFEAFTTVVRRKTDRLFRIAGLDWSALGRVTLSDPLIKALAQEACDVAGQFLRICIRAIDYCPPVDLDLGEYLRALITADGDLERTDPWGIREALMRSFRRRHIFPDHVRFMTEDAVRWQTPEGRFRIPGLAFRDLRFAGDPGRPADEEELVRQAKALGRFVTNPANAAAFRLVAPGAPLPDGVVQASPALIQSVRVSRRTSNDKAVVFDVVAEVTQSCTVKRKGEMFDMNCGSTVVIDPEGVVRYAISKRCSPGRQARQQAAMHGPLETFWKKDGRRYSLRPDVLKRLHQFE